MQVWLTYIIAPHSTVLHFTIEFIVRCKDIPIKATMAFLQFYSLQISSILLDSTLHSPTLRLSLFLSLSLIISLTHVRKHTPDNHDVISLITYVNQDVLEAAENKKQGLNNTIFASKPEGMSRLDRLSRYVATIKRK